MLKMDDMIRQYEVLMSKEFSDYKNCISTKVFYFSEIHPESNIRCRVKTVNINLRGG